MNPELLTTRVLPLSDPEAQNLAVALLNSCQVIAAPTDTVYGIFGRYTTTHAIQRIYIAKARPPDKAIPVLISDVEQMAQLTSMPINAVAAALMARFWPGALTLILPALPHLPAILTAGQATIAVRMPDHAELRAFLRRTGPLAATSANTSGGPECHTPAEVLRQLDGHIPLLLADEPGATATDSPASTIVDVVDPAAPRIVREGPLGATVRGLLAALPDIPQPEAPQPADAHPTNADWH